MHWTKSGTIRICRDMGFTLSDGTRLSAQVWMPDDAETHPKPVILEYLPYRKSDGTAQRDHGMHLHFSQNGYVSVRLDRRGCGDSEGSFDDEYSPQELADGVEAIALIAAKPWCNGRVGIQGISWGGFNGLQLAALRPPALKAVISIGTTVNRFTDDIHYKGGVQLSENIGWAATATSWNSMPPDPELCSNWRDIWLQRLTDMPFLASTWTRHKDRDSYWKHGSVCEDWSAIEAPVLVMGGLHDGYRNAMAALVENCKSVVKGIAGPWNHKYPNISGIEPKIDYLGEALRWWDHWLKGRDTGVEDDPDYRAFLMDSCAPDPALNKRAGRWVVEQNWPSENLSRESFEFGPGTLGARTAFSKDISQDLKCGRMCGEYFPFGFGPGELPGDQTSDDARSCCFDGKKVVTDIDILGAPLVSLKLAASRSCAQVIVRLCDLRPDGTSNLISLGMLNLRHLEGDDQARDLVPGQVYDLDIKLDQTAYRLPAGHRLRVAVSTSYWPYAWPEGQAFSLNLTGGSLSIPCRNRPAVSDECHFAPPCEMATRPMEVLEQAKESKTWETDPITGEITLSITTGRDRVRDLVNGLITGGALREVWRIHPDDPASARAEITWERWLQRGEIETGSHLTAVMQATPDHFEISQKLMAYENGKRIFEKTWEDRVAR